MRKVLCAVLMSCLVAACGGGGGGSPPADPMASIRLQNLTTCTFNCLEIWYEGVYEGLICDPDAVVPGETQTSSPIYPYGFYDFRFIDSVTNCYVEFFDQVVDTPVHTMTAF